MCVWAIDGDCLKILLRSKNEDGVSSTREDGRVGRVTGDRVRVSLLYNSIVWLVRVLGRGKKKKYKVYIFRFYDDRYTGVRELLRPVAVDGRVLALEP